LRTSRRTEKSASPTVSPARVAICPIAPCPCLPRGVPLG
jgi:hypothetical protein